MTTTNAIRVHAFGGPEVLTWEAIPLPAAPGPGEVLLRHTAIGLNFIEVYQRTGLYPMPLPFCPGSNAAGVVEAVGPGVTEVKPGDRVAYGTGPNGAYSERRVFPTDKLVRIPDGIGDETAAAALLQGMTVRYLIKETYPVTKGTTILLYAAVGGVGTMLTQWAKALGATVIGVVSSDAKAAQAKQNGCDHALVFGRDDIAAQAKALTGGQGVDVVYDSVGKDSFLISLDALRPRGMMVSFGNASGPVDPISPLILSQKGSLFLTRPTLGHYVATRDALLANATDLFHAIQTGLVRIAVNQRFALKDAAQAHAALQGRATTGSTVLLP